MEIDNINGLSIEQIKHFLQNGSFIWPIPAKDDNILHG